MIQAKIGRIVLRHVGATGLVEFAGPTQIAATEMEQSYRRLDQPLVEAPFGSSALQPDALPRFMGLEEIAAIEEEDTCQIARIVFQFRTFR